MCNFVSTTISLQLFNLQVVLLVKQLPPKENNEDETLQLQFTKLLNLFSST
jgi:hypothetical protein